MGPGGFCRHLLVLGYPRGLIPCIEPVNISQTFARVATFSTQIFWKVSEGDVGSTMQTFKVQRQGGPKCLVLGVNATGEVVSSLDLFIANPAPPPGSPDPAQSGAVINIEGVGQLGTLSPMSGANNEANSLVTPIRDVSFLDVVPAHSPAMSDGEPLTVILEGTTMGGSLQSAVAVGEDLWDPGHTVRCWRINLNMPLLRENSGAPVVNAAGTMVGMFQTIQGGGVGFVIPLEELR